MHRRFFIQILLYEVYPKVIEALLYYVEKKSAPGKNKPTVKSSNVYTE